jgi:hypothetical protein
MPTRNKYRLKPLVDRDSSVFPSGYGFMRGTVTILGDIVGPTGEEPWDSEADVDEHDANGLGTPRMEVK